MLVETRSPPALDEVWAPDLPLTKRAMFYPLGFPLEVATNSDAVMAAARQSWGTFSLACPEAPLSLEIAVLGDADDLPPRPLFRTQKHLLSIVADARNQIVCDLQGGYAAGWVTRRVSEQEQFLRLHFLEAAVAVMLVDAHLAALHSALVARRGSGVILCGDSHAGKSTLAYACARSGWTYVADDGTFLLRHREGLYAVGNPTTIRFREDAKCLFPELSRHRVALRPNGEPGMEVLTSELPVTTAGGCAIDHVVFLRRSDAGAARINRVEPGEALDWFERVTFYGPSETRESQRKTYRQLLDANLWELHYSNLGDAVRSLDKLVDENRLDENRLDGNRSV